MFSFFSIGPRNQCQVNKTVLEQYNNNAFEYNNRIYLLWTFFRLSDTYLFETQLFILIGSDFVRINLSRIE